jgi:hypothetical protein
MVGDFIHPNPPPHDDANCQRVSRAIECPFCGYPASEAFWFLPNEVADLEFKLLNAALDITLHQ